MRVVLLGKRRYSEGPTISRFLAGAAPRGHTAELLDRDALVASDLSGVDLVLAKSHYKDAEVRRHLASVGAVVVNDLTATALCESRHGLASRRTDRGVPTPAFLRTRFDADAMPLPWIAKPDRGGNHQHAVLLRRPRSVDQAATFYQKFLPSRQVFKVYSIGARHDVVELTYPSSTELHQPARTYRGEAPKPLANAARRIGAATGLSVFNTDFIEHGPDYVAIDVNPFPSLESVPNADTHLWALVESL